MGSSVNREELLSKLSSCQEPEGLQNKMSHIQWKSEQQRDPLATGAIFRLQSPMPRVLSREPAASGSNGAAVRPQVLRAPPPLPRTTYQPASTIARPSAVQATPRPRPPPLVGAHKPMAIHAPVPVGSPSRAATKVTEEHPGALRPLTAAEAWVRSSAAKEIHANFENLVKASPAPRVRCNPFR